MSVLVILVLASGACQASTFNGGAGVRCRYPNWRCDCKLVYDCLGESIFPEDYEDADPAEGGLVKDLAPNYHPIEIPGKRWRRNSHNQEEYCQRECTDRLNAFLSLDEGDRSLTDYSYSALCVVLLGLGDDPFMAFMGFPEPCCTIHLEYGRQWCAPKENRVVDTLRCLSRGVDPSFPGVASGANVHNVFSAEGGCDPNLVEITWCDAIPTCPAEEEDLLK